MMGAGSNRLVNSLTLVDGARSAGVGAVEAGQVEREQAFELGQAFGEGCGLEQALLLLGGEAEGLAQGVGEGAVVELAQMGERLLSPPWLRRARRRR